MIADVHNEATVLISGIMSHRSGDDVALGVIFRIFLPCCAACIVIAFSLWVNQMLCCVTGCCKGPPAKAPEGKKGTEMQSVTVGDEFKDLSQP